MYLMLDTIDKYIKENNIPFNSIMINKTFLPNFINMAILREVRKSIHSPFAEVNNDYEIRFDKNGKIYLLVTNDKNRENFIIVKDTTPIKEKFNVTCKSEKHIIKMGCLFKILDQDIKTLNDEIKKDYSGLKSNEKARLEYEIIDDMLEDKYNKMVKNHKFILDEVSYEDELIESTYKIIDYIRYLFEIYKDSNNSKRKR